MISILLILWEFYLCHSNMDWIWKKKPTNWYLFSLFYFKQFWLKTYFLYEKKISFLLYAREKTLIGNTEIMFIINISVQVFYIMVKKFFVCFGHMSTAAIDLECLLFRIHDMFHPSFDSQVCRSNYSVAWFHNNSRWVSS